MRVRVPPPVSYGIRESPANAHAHRCRRFRAIGFFSKTPRFALQSALLTPQPFLPIPKRTALPIVPQIATPDTTPTPRHHHWPRLAVLTLAWPAQVWCVKDLPQARTYKGHADNRRGLGRIAGGRLLNPTAAQAEKGGASQEEDRTRRLGSKIRIQKEDAHFAIVEASSGDLARVIDGAS